MDSYRTLMSCACWAALVCWLAGSTASHKEELELTVAHAEYCAVDIGRRLAHVEAQVQPYLEVYRDVLMPALVDAGD